MATPVRMPKLGMSMREGTVVDWPRATGDAVAKGEVLLVIESEKAEVEVEATASGVLAHIYVEVGQTVPCGTLLAALVEDAGEAFDAEAFRAEQDAVSPSAEAAGYGGVGDQGRAVVGSPSAQGEGAQRSDRRRPVAPAARARARELGVDLDRVTGSGPGGRVTRADVDAWVASRRDLVEVAPGLGLEVPSAGSGDTVLMLPGFGTDASSFAPQTAELVSNFHVRVLHPRGIGASDPGDVDVVGPSLVAADAAAVLDGPAHVVGASFGAAVAVDLALRRPDLVRSLVLVTPALRPDPRLLAVLDAWQRLAAEATPELLAAAMLPWLFSGAYLADADRAERTARGFAAMTMRTPAVALGRMRRGLAEAECAALDAIEVPTLVVGAGGDLLTTDARAVADAIPGAVFVEIAGAGHAVCLESAAAVTTALERHLRN